MTDIPARIMEEARRCAGEWNLIDAIAATLLAAEQRARKEAVRVKALEWGDHQQPNENIRYDHCLADSIFGTVSIEWKSWKDYPIYTVIIGDHVLNENGIEEAKAAAQSYYEHRILSALAVENARLRFEGDLDKWMKIIGAGITGYQPEAYAVMDVACEELVKLRAENERLRGAVEEAAKVAERLLKFADTTSDADKEIPAAIRALVNEKEG